MQKSSVPVSHGFPNPHFGNAKYLVQHQAEILDLIRLVKDVDKKCTIAGQPRNLKKLHELLGDTTLRSRLREIWKSQTQGHVTRPVIPSPPNTVVVYGRFAKHSKIVDIGSGGCAKLRKYTGDLLITAVDPMLKNGDLVMKTRSVKIEDCGDLFQPSAWFTSWMSMPVLELSVQAKIFNYNGIHLVPDHSYLEALNVATQLENGKILVNVPGRCYEDHVIACDQGYPIDGYKVVATFHRVDVAVTIDFEKTHYGDEIEVDATPGSIEELNPDDLSYKYDGVAVELELFNGQAYMTDRSRKMWEGTSDFGVDRHLCVHLEKLDKAYVVIRVVTYDGVVPPHCGDILRMFASRVKIKINDMPVIGPEKYCEPVLTEHPVDGVISRDGEKDLYFKWTWTVDLYKYDIPVVKKTVNDLGLRFDIDYGAFLDVWDCELMEFSLKRVVDKVSLEAVKYRHDKTKSTSIDTVAYLLDKATLSEVKIFRD